MDPTSSTVLGLEHQARSISAQLGDTERNRFIAATVGLKNDNQLVVIDYDEDSLDISTCIFDHPFEILNQSPCPSNSDLIFITDTSVSDSKISHNCTLYHMESDIPLDASIPRNSTGQLIKKCAISSPLFGSGIESIVWDIDTCKRVLATSKSSYALYKMNTDYIPILNGSVSEIPGSINKCVWNPHNNEQVLFAFNNSISSLDLKSNKSIFSISDAHLLAVNDLDYNPNKPFVFASCGNDCIVKFWDVRNLTSPIHEIENHTHWVKSIYYNRFHDQLFLSSSSDCLVNLTSIVSISSFVAVSGSATSNDEVDERQEFERPVDGLVKSFDDHEYAVYSVAWSNLDPWIFASLSYDGRVVVNQVPKEHKYKIIL